ncbi:hypothetical protein MGA5115_03289 [Marinomonas gallaica]|uniref:Uncharacterized protein n=1 Tax=Marinomonas gallaica TaxID=1806667 RepID=A0A1C3JV82_9GAMM|nr:hypothetical protein [Marinomonas gallaica]SBT19128.1 hypothetical protein MGA5115_03289 [Marinomonas gallaica]SBT22720.1 hypothetical protein MGA5116_03345 [Marinomonas gallaica]
MLSSQTADFLNLACEKSDKLYDQGGLIYLYKYGHRRAHTLFEKNILAQASSPKKLDVDEARQLEEFFGCALEEPFGANVTIDVSSFVEELTRKLNIGFNGMYSYVSSSTKDGDSMEIVVSFLESNDFHNLELFWSID